jgi:hypothetical protein
MQNRMRKLIMGLVLILATGCRISTLFLDSGLPEVYPALDEPAATLDALRTQTMAARLPTSLPETATPEIVEGTGTDVPCAYVWDTQPLQEETALLQVAFRNNSLSRAEVWAEAYGERCVNVVTKNTVGGFLILQTDVHVRMAVLDMEDEDALGRLLAQITRTVSELPEDAFPGTQKGYVGVEFSQDGELLNFWYLLSEGEDALEVGLQGAVFLNALR